MIKKQIVAYFVLGLAIFCENNTWGMAARAKAMIPAFKSGLESGMQSIKSGEVSWGVRAPKSVPKPFQGEIQQIFKGPGGPTLDGSVPNLTATSRGIIGSGANAREVEFKRGFLGFGKKVELVARGQEKYLQPFVSEGVSGPGLNKPGLGGHEPYTVISIYPSRAQYKPPFVSPGIDMPGQQKQKIYRDFGTQTDGLGFIAGQNVLGKKTFQSIGTQTDELGSVPVQTVATRTSSGSLKRPGMVAGEPIRISPQYGTEDIRRSNYEEGPDRTVTPMNYEDTNRPSNFMEDERGAATSSGSLKRPGMVAGKPIRVFPTESTEGIRRSDNEVGPERIVGLTQYADTNRPSNFMEDERQTRLRGNYNFETQGGSKDSYKPVIFSENNSRENIGQDEANAWSGLMGEFQAGVPTVSVRPSITGVQDATFSADTPGQGIIFEQDESVRRTEPDFYSATKRSMQRSMQRGVDQPRSSGDDIRESIQRPASEVRGLVRSSEERNLGTRDNLGLPEDRMSIPEDDIVPSVIRIPETVPGGVVPGVTNIIPVAPASIVQPINPVINRANQGGRIRAMGQQFEGPGFQERLKEIDTNEHTGRQIITKAEPKARKALKTQIEQELAQMRIKQSELANRQGIASNETGGFADIEQSGLSGLENINRRDIARQQVLGANDLSNMNLIGQEIAGREDVSGQENLARAPLRLNLLGAQEADARKQLQAREQDSFNQGIMDPQSMIREQHWYKAAQAEANLAKIAQKQKAEREAELEAMRNKNKQ